MSHYFFDAHMHAMNLIHPNFVSFVDSVADNITEFVTSGALSSGYLLTPANRGQQGLVTLLNMFSVFERPIGEIFALMEEDLSGAFTHRQAVVKGKKPVNIMYPEKPYIRDGKLHFRSMVYDKYALVPLVMDFSRLSSDEDSRSYYTNELQEKILSYVKDTLDGIDWYRSVRPQGMMEFFPFLGINPEVHELDFIQELLATYVRSDTSPTWGPRRIKAPKRFRGVKFYPPLGTDPWPKDAYKRKKIEYIYRFCESNNVPIVTHCDDQGFRGVPAKLAQQYTDPSAWRPVLERFPKLKIDFAHYGRQYNPIGKSPLRAFLDTTWINDQWFTAIVDLMMEYEHVYADFSFSGTDPDFYSDLSGFIHGLEDEHMTKTILERSMFGSDFSVNLAKVESYSNYLKIFEESPFTDDEIDGFVSRNPIRFLGLDL